MSLLFLRLRQYRDGKIQRASRTLDITIVVLGWLLIAFIFFKVFIGDW